MTEETRIEYLERNIAEVRAQRSLLENASWEKVQREDPDLRSLEDKMVRELHDLRPFAVRKNGDSFIIAHRGMFVLADDGENWLTFGNEDQAHRWIAAQEAGVAA